MVLKEGMGLLRMNMEPHQAQGGYMMIQPMNIMPQPENLNYRQKSISDCLIILINQLLILLPIVCCLVRSVRIGL